MSTDNTHMSQVFQQVIKRIEEENRANNVRLVFHGFLTAAMIFSLLFVYITQDCPQ